uniref:Zinc finger, AN1-type domain 1 n=1 Tax=Gasterosteus aculeatus TaxID=69293 RepID=G3NIX6_GASAC
MMICAGHMQRKSHGKWFNTIYHYFMNAFIMKFHFSLVLLTAIVIKMITSVRSWKSKSLGWPPPKSWCKRLLVSYNAVRHRWFP